MDTLTRLKESNTRVGIKYPFFRKALNRMTYIDGSEKRIPTCAVTDKLEFYYNSEFVEKELSDDVSLDFVTIHELLHVVHRHNVRHNPDYSNIENNIAMDLEINSVITNILGYRKLDSGVYPFTFNLPELQSFEFYLKNLPREEVKMDLIMTDMKDYQEKLKGDDSKSSADKSESDDESDDGSKDDSDNSSDSSDEDESKDKSDKESDESKDKSGEKSNDDSKDKPSDSEDQDKSDEDKEISKEIGELGKIIQDKIEKKLQDIKNRSHEDEEDERIDEKDRNEEDKTYSLDDLIHVLSSSKVNLRDDYSYSKIHRRSYGSRSKFIRPGLLGVKRCYKLALILDISPSMESVQHSVFNTVYDFYDKHRNSLNLEVDLYLCSDTCRDVINIKDIDRSKTYYGNGTWMFSGYDKICSGNIKYDDIVIITDGEDDSYPEFEKYDKRVFICLTPSYYINNVVSYINSLGNENLVTIKLEVDDED